VPKLYCKKPNPQLNLFPKCLALQNWRLILKMIDEQGWILRNTVIWHKQNHMPSSVRDRLTNSYEPVFFLTKSKRYFFDLDAIRVPHTVCGVTDKRPMGILRQKLYPNSSYNQSDDPHLAQYKFNSASHNWKLRNTPNPMEWRKTAQTHYPQDQAENFGSPRARYWREKELQKKLNPAILTGGDGRTRAGLDSKTAEEKIHPAGKNPGDVWTIATQPAPPEVRGKHFARFPDKLIEPMILAGCPAQGIVLDPFMGSGTTAVVAKKLGRNFIGIELNPEYVALATERVNAIKPQNKLF